MLEGAVSGLGYANSGDLWYTFDDEEWVAVKTFKSDRDIINMINRSRAEKRKILNIFVEHVIDEAELLDLDSPLLLEDGPLTDEGCGDDDDDNNEVEGDGKEEGLEYGTDLSDFSEKDIEDADAYVDIQSPHDAHNETQPQVDWFGAFPRTPGGEKGEGNDSEYEDYEDFRSVDGSDSDENPRMRRFAEFNEQTDLQGEISLYKGLIFPTTAVLRKALRKYSIQKHFDYIYLKNDRVRVQARCQEDGCEFYVFASKMRDYDGIQIKSFISEHNCGAHYENTKCNVQFLAHHYLPNFRDQPSWSVAAMKGQIRREFNINVLYTVVTERRGWHVEWVMGIKQNSSSSWGGTH